MLFVIHAIDKLGTGVLRQSVYAAHRDYIDKVAQYGVRSIISGPLLADDGKTVIGSHLVIEAKDHAVAEAFHHADPFFKAGLWDQSGPIVFDKKVG